MKQFFLIFFVVFIGFFNAADAEEGKPAADLAAWQRRLELAQKIQAIQPVRGQVESAIDKMAETMPAEKRASFRAEMLTVLNGKAVEKITQDAMADIYTEAELKTLLEFYSKPEAQSAKKKDQQYAQRVFGQILQLIDQAKMRSITGAGN